jgi:hypothetical protein
LVLLYQVGCVVSQRDLFLTELIQLLLLALELRHQLLILLQGGRHNRQAGSQTDSRGKQLSVAALKDS